jgi:hypothetical protein
VDELERLAREVNPERLRQETSQRHVLPTARDVQAALDELERSLRTPAPAVPRTVSVDQARAGLARLLRRPVHTIPLDQPGPDATELTPVRKAEVPIRERKTLNPLDDPAPLPGATDDRTQLSLQAAAPPVAATMPAVPEVIDTGFLPNPGPNATRPPDGYMSLRIPAALLEPLVREAEQARQAEPDEPDDEPDDDPDNDPDNDPPTQSHMVSPDAIDPNTGKAELSAELDLTRPTTLPEAAARPADEAPELIPPAVAMTPAPAPAPAPGDSSESGLRPLAPADLHSDDRDEDQDAAGPVDADPEPPPSAPEASRESEVDLDVRSREPEAAVSEPEPASEAEPEVRATYRPVVLGPVARDVLRRSAARIPVWRPEEPAAEPASPGAGDADPGPPPAPAPEPPSAPPELRSSRDSHAASGSLIIPIDVESETSAPRPRSIPPTLDGEQRSPLAGMALGNPPPEAEAPWQRTPPRRPITSQSTIDPEDFNDDESPTEWGQHMTDEHSHATAGDADSGRRVFEQIMAAERKPTRSGRREAAPEPEGTEGARPTEGEAPPEDGNDPPKRGLWRKIFGR